MKLKYYLRGMGAGMIFAALIMGVALGGRTETLSDSEIIERAKELGMVEGDKLLLSDYATSNQSGDVVNEENSVTSGSEIYQEGKEVSEEVDEEESVSDSEISDVSEEETQGKNESAKASEDASSGDSNTEENYSFSSEITSNELVNNAATAETSDSSVVMTTADSSAAAATDEEVVVTETAVADQADNASDSATTAAARETSVATTAGSTNYIVVVIPGRSGSDTAAAVLEQAGLVDSAVTFNKYLIDKGMDRRIHSGTKQIPAGSSYEEIANIICSG